MGCFGSRMDSRRKALDKDWTGADFAFAVANLKTLEGFCPLDKIAVAFCGGEGKELKDGIGELTDAKMAEDKAKELGKKIFDAMEKLYNDLVDDYKDGTKEGEVFGKYTGTDAIAQMDACLKTYAEKSGVEGLTWPKAAEATAEMMESGMMEGMMEEAAAMEGGEMMEGEMAAMEGEAAAPAKKMSLIAADAFGEATGPAELPKLLLSLLFYHPVFGDAVKSQTMHFELGGDSNKDMAEVATIAAAYVNAGESAEADSFGCAVLNDDDLEELKAVVGAKEDQALVFPGVVGAWASEEDAMGQCNDATGKTKVLFKFKGKVMKPAGDKLHVFCRQFSTVESLEEPAEGKDFMVCTLGDYTEKVFATVAEYTAAAAEAVKALEAVKDAVEDKMMEAEMMMEGEKMEMAEGEAM